MNAQAPPFALLSGENSDPQPVKVDEESEQVPTVANELEANDAESLAEGENQIEESRPAQPQVMRILRRENKRHNSLHRGSSSDSGEGSDAVDQRRTMSIEERELAYGLARARIFADDTEVPGDLPRSGSSSPKLEQLLKGVGNDLQSPALPSTSISCLQGAAPTTMAEASKSKGKKPVSNNNNYNNAGPVSRNQSTNGGNKLPRQQPKPKPQFRPPAAVAQMYGHPAMFASSANPYGGDPQARPHEKYPNMNIGPHNFPPYAFNNYNGRPPSVPAMYTNNQGNVMGSGIPGPDQIYAYNGTLITLPGTGLGQGPYKSDGFYPGAENTMWPPASTYSSPMSQPIFPVGHGMGFPSPHVSQGNPIQQAPFQQRYARPMLRPSPRRQEQLKPRPTLNKSNYE